MRNSKIARTIKRLYRLLSSLRISSYRNLFFLSCAKGSPVIDLGANVGQSALIFWLRGIECFCFEPDPRAYKVLELLFRDVSFIHTYNLAVVSDSDFKSNQKLPFFVHLDSDLAKSRLDYTQASSLMSDKINVNNLSPIYVDCIRFSDVVSMAKRFSLLKCDIEGYEYQLYPDVAHHLDKFDLVLMETHAKKNPQWNVSHAQLEKQIEDIGASSKWSISWH